MLRIYLARHGETAWNRELRLQGASDIELNETGHAQAARLAERLAGVELDRIYCSHRKRSRQTAAALGERAPLTVVEGLAEQSLGSFEGKRMDGTDGDVLGDFVRRIRDPDDDLDGGESLHQHLARVAQAVADILVAHPAGTILIVGHGGTNAMVLRTMLGLTAAETWSIHQANDEIYRIDIEEGRPVAILISRTDGTWLDAGLPL